MHELAATKKVVVACRGQTYSLQPKQMVYTLPGSNYKEADLHQIHEEALQEADVALLADAWEASFCTLVSMLVILSLCLSHMQAWQQHAACP